jgi:hypothetical protein
MRASLRAPGENEMGIKDPKPQSLMRRQAVPRWRENAASDRNCKSFGLACLATQHPDMEFVAIR